VGVLLLFQTPAFRAVNPSSSWLDALISISMLVYVTLVALIALRRPGNTIG